MAVEFVGVTTGETTTTANLVVAPHASAQSGDLLLLSAMHVYSNSAAPAPSSPEWNHIISGWSGFAANDSFWTAHYWAWYDDYVTSAVPVGNANNGRAVTLSVWRGCDSLTPIEAHIPAIGYSIDLTASLPAVTTTTANARVVNFLGLGDNDRTVTAFSNANLVGLTKHSDVRFSIVFGAGMVLFSGLKEEPGSSGGTSVTINFGDYRFHHSIALIEQQIRGGGGLMLMGVG